MSTTASGNGAGPTPSLANMRSQTAATAPTRQRVAQPVAPEAGLPMIGIGFGNLQQWEFTQRVARGLANSTLVPEAYRAWVQKGRGRNAEWQENKSAIPNCIIALNMATRSGEDVLAVMQNLHIIEGRPSWSSPYIISRVNQTKRYTPLKFRIFDKGETVAVYEGFEWRDTERGSARVPTTENVTLKHNMACVAYCRERDGGEELEGPEVSLAMAVGEGWYTKKGSKWKTMPELMLRYRAAAFFARTNCPEVLMGLPTQEEVGDIIEAHQTGPGEWETSTDLENPDDQPGGGAPPMPPSDEDDSGQGEQTDAPEQSEGSQSQGSEKTEEAAAGAGQDAAAQVVGDEVEQRAEAQEQQQAEIPSDKEPPPPTENGEGAGEQSQQGPRTAQAEPPPQQISVRPEIQRALDWEKKRQDELKTISRGQAMSQMKHANFINSIAAIEALGPDGKTIADRVRKAYEAKINGDSGASGK